MGKGDLTSLSGVVSHVERRSETSGYIYNDSGNIRTRAISTSFRIDGTPATVSGSPVLSSGDRLCIELEKFWPLRLRPRLVQGSEV